jgi:transcriptional regulator GlxA family with amidase domain
LVSAHIRDLIAIALGATRDGAVIANAGGVRAARLKAIKTDILKNLASPGLTIIEVARLQRVTPRYIQMLFKSEGATFSEFLCEQRLRRAHSMLLQPCFCDKNVTAIAFAAGFSDLSYFNRCFRRRFGTAPSELRRDVCRPHRSDAG